jgi:dethiobiotin synthetase
MSEFGCFVTGTDTEIGKTLIASTLVHAFAQRGLRSVGMKPVAAGAEFIDGRWRNDDVDALVRASNVALPQELVAPYLFRTPAAPHLVAADEGVEIDLAHILACHAQITAQADAVVVEGVGGFRVPLSNHASRQTDTADLAKALGLPVVMVVGIRLGCISHALLTAEAIAARGLTLLGWVANVADPHMLHADNNVKALRERLPGHFLGCVPRLQEATPEQALPHLDLSPLF